MQTKKLLTETFVFTTVGVPHLNSASVELIAKSLNKLCSMH